MLILFVKCKNLLEGQSLDSSGMTQHKLLSYSDWLTVDIQYGKDFKPALRLAPQKQEVISRVMLTHVNSGCVAS